jgi:hypothetical protein
MTGHVIDTATPRRLDGIVRDPALRAAIGYWDSLRGARACRRGWTSTPPYVAPASAGRRHPRGGGPRQPAHPAGRRADQRASGHGCAGPAAPGAVRPVGTGPHLGRGGGGDRGRALLILDVTSPAPRFGRPEDEALRAQIAILPMTDADLGPTRALYVMGAVSGEPRKADAPHRWCVHGDPQRCPCARASRCCGMRRFRAAPRPVRPPRLGR